ncbi:MAG TPA: phospholipase D-like domain-containing protein [Thermoleophilaceae bacterium]|jgi:hypothetical protein
MYRLAILVVTAACAALLLAPAAQAGRVVPVQLGQKSGEVIFANGQPSAPDPAILVHLEGLIDRAAPDSTIVASIYAITRNGRIEDALRRAYTDPARRIRVQIVSNESGLKPGEPFDDWPASDRFKFKNCSGGCISLTNPENGNASIAHSKFFVFQATRRTATSPIVPVSWVASANLDANTGTDAWNDAITWYDDPDMNWGLYTVFLDMWNGPYYTKGFPESHPWFDYFTWPNDNPTTAGNGAFFAPDSASTGIVSPELDSDLWVTQLSMIKGPGAGGAPVCRVAVLHNKIFKERIAVVRQLRRLVNEDCVVRVLVNRTVGSADDPAHPEIDEPSRTELCAPTNGDLQVGATTKLHHKAIISYGTFYGVSRPVVWAGSHNLSEVALKANDEVIVRVDGSQSLWDAYAQQFLDAWNARAVTICTP